MTKPLKIQNKHKITIGRWSVLCALLSILLLCPTVAFAQRNDKILNRPYADQKLMHLGFSVGMHFQDLAFTHNGFVTPDDQAWFVEVPAYSPGFNVGVLADLRLHKNFNLRLSPGMFFGNKTAKMIDANSRNMVSQDIKSAYVTLPLDLKISGDRYHNTRPYVTAGVMGAFDVSKRRSDYLQFNTCDVYLSLGMGVEFYLPFFKLNPEIKFCFGLTDVLRHDRPDLVDDPETLKITESLSKVKSKMIILTFYFE